MNRRVFGRSPRTYKNSEEEDFQTIRYENFDGGYNNNSSPMSIDDNQSPDLLNVVLDERGAIKKRKGLTPWLTQEIVAPNGIQGMFYASNAGIRYLIVAAGGKLWHVPDSGTPIELGELVTSTKRVYFTQLLSAVFVCEVGELLKKWNFSTFSAVTGAKKLSYLWNWTNGLFGLSSGNNGGDDSTSRIWYTDALDEDISQNFLDLERQDGDECVVAKVFGKNSLVWKRTATHRLFWNDDFTILYRDIADSEIGCIGSSAVQSMEGTYAVLSDDGFKKFDRVQFLDEIKTDRFDQDIEPLVDLINQKSSEQTVTSYFKRKFYAFFPVGSSTVANLGAVYDTRYEKWVRWNNWTPSCFVKYTDNNKVIHHLMGDATKGMIYEVEQGYSDNRQPYNSYWKSKWFDLGGLDLDKFLRFMDILLKGLRGTVQVNIYIDEELFLTETIKTAVAGTFGSGGMARNTVARTTTGRSGGEIARFKEFIMPRISVARDGDHAVGKRLQVEIRNDSADEDWGLLAFSFHAKAFTRKRFDAEEII